MLVDAHMHIWDKVDGRIGDITVKALANGLVQIGEQVLLGMPPSCFDGRCTAEFAVAHFDDAGVEVGVVVQETMDGIQNDYCLETMRKYPGRFFCHALLDYWKPDTCLTQYETVRKQGFRGVKLPAMRLAQMNPRLTLTDPRLMSVWEAMQADGAVLAVDLDFGASQVEEMAAVAKAFPNLPIVLGHFAMANRPEWIDQLRLGRLPNVYVESGGICWLFREEGYPFPQAQHSIKLAAEEIGVEKILWGSDLPRTMVDYTYRQLLDFARDGLKFFSEREKDLFLGGNAARVYHLDTNVPERKPFTLITA